MSDLKFTTAADYMKVDYSLHVLYTRHGGAYDRGLADSYNGRNRDPHYYPEGSYSAPRVNIDEMTAEEIAAYNQGYDDNERSGAKKVY